MLSFGLITLVGIFLLIVLFTAMAWRRVVPTNRVDIVQYRNKTVTYGHGYPAGNVYYRIPASIPRFGVRITEHPLWNFDIELFDYEAYDTEKVPFMVDVTGFFRVADPEITAERIQSIEELEKQLFKILKGTVRRVLSTDDLENIMQDRAGLGERFTQEVEDQLKEWGVKTTKMVEFMDIRDIPGSKVIDNIMAKKKSFIEMESRVEVANNKREAESKEIENTREIEMSRIQAEQQVGERDAEKDKTVGIAKEKSNQEVQSEAKVTAEREMDVIRVRQVEQASIDKSVAEVDAAKDREVRVISAEADQKSQVIMAEGDRDAKIQIAEGDLQAKLKESKGIEAEGAARAETERLMQLAPVNAQITLAQEIGTNEGYQKYLIEIRGVEATEAVGKAMAGAIEKADLKVIANGGDVQSGMGNLMDIFGTKGGTSLAGMLEALGQTDAGKALVDKVTGTEETKVTPRKKA